jgi:hypothetical protein
MRLLLLSVFLLPWPLQAADWQPAPTPLMTRWGKAIRSEVTPWREYPRPQLVRKEWSNLNGLWDYAITPREAGPPTRWDGKILVPFCLESALSGVGKRLNEKQHLWYRRSLDASAWAGRRVLLHFGAVDWHCTVFVNGQQVGDHKGGFDPFHFDITDALQAGKSELLVRVWDPTEKGSQPLGKQLSNPHGIWYTPVSGIWQTVWMEPINPAAVRSVRFIADPATGRVEAEVEADPAADVEIALPSGQRLASGKAGRPLRFHIADFRPWTPDSPHLVHVLIRSTLGDSRDEVGSYFAFRTISTGKDERGILRLLLNGKPLFHFGPLDQGWWPDGLLTPPSEEAMRYDLEVLKKLGMNMLRKHIKVEPARFYYDCDRLGLLVWQDMPSAINRTRKHFVDPKADRDADDQFTAEEKKQFRAELKAMIDHLRFFPSVVVWVPFNEGWGQHDTNAILRWVKEYDPSRLVNGPSGWTDRGYGDMKDAHIYPGPGMFPVMPDRVSVLGEFGGLGLPVKGHLWKDTGNWGYRTFQSSDELRRGYRALMLQLHPLIDRGLAAAVYTQTTDVEIEINGLLTYDREVLKFDADDMARWHRELFGPVPVWRELVPTSEKVAQTWSYTTTNPGEGWQQSAFKESATWKQGKGGFGAKGTPGAVLGTEWTTRDIWMRRSFELQQVPAGEILLRVHYDEDAEVYLNGVLATRLPGYTVAYSLVPLTAEARRALRTGNNVLAVRARNAGGGQYIDVGLIVRQPSSGAK